MIPESIKKLYTDLQPPNEATGSPKHEFTKAKIQNDSESSSYAEASAKSLKLGLCLLIQEHRASKTLTVDSELNDTVQSLRGLLEGHEGLFDEYADIIKTFSSLAPKKDEEGKRFIDIDSETISDKIDNWTSKLLTELEHTKDLNQEEKETIQGQVNIFFSTLANEMNAQTFIKDIKEFFTSEYENQFKRQEIAQLMAKKHEMTESEARILIEIISPNKFSFGTIFKTINNLSEQYDLNQHKAKIFKTSSIHLAAAAIDTIGNSLSFHSYSNPFAATFRWAGNAVKKRGNDSRVEIMKLLQEKLTKRVSQALVYQKFPDMDDAKFAELHTKLENGKRASYEILDNLMGDLGPQAFMTSLSSLFILGIHPALGAINIRGLKTVVNKSQEMSNKLLDIQTKQRRAAQDNHLKVLSIVQGGEEVILSPNKNEIHEKLHAGLSVQDSHSIDLMKISDELRDSINSFFWKTMGLSSTTAASMVGIGQFIDPNSFFSMSNKAGIASYGVTAGMNVPFINLLVNFHTQFKSQLLKIYEMEELLGQGVLDLPDGEIEAQRISVSALADHSIEIEAVGFKDVLNDINHRIEPGEFVTITGLSGSGKTTLIKNLLGLYTPDSGRVTIGANPREEIKRHGKEGVNNLVTYCGQRPYYIEHETLRENLLFGSFREDISEEQILSAMDALGLSKYEGKLDKILTKPSGGERLRIVLARAFLREGSVIVLDEPTAALDHKTTNKVIELLQGIHKKFPEKTIICITHTETVMNSGDRNFDLSEYQEAQEKELDKHKLKPI